MRLEEGGYRLREQVRFHLYVSSSPCGDARLHSPYEFTAECKSGQFCVGLGLRALTPQNSLPN